MYKKFLKKYNPQIQKSGETKTKGSKSGKNRGKSQFQAVIEIQITQHRNDKKRALETKQIRCSFFAYRSRNIIKHYVRVMGIIVH